MYVFYTCLQPKVDTTKSDVKSTDVGGIKINTHVTSQTGYNVKFFCKEDEMNVLKKYCPQIGSTGAIYRAQLVIDGVYMTVLEYIEPEIKPVKGAIDMYECTLFVKTETINAHIYE